jgi:hypothetical protein
MNAVVGRRGLEPRTSALDRAERCAYELRVTSAAAGFMWYPDTGLVEVAVLAKRTGTRTMPSEASRSTRRWSLPQC